MQVQPALIPVMLWISSSTPIELLNTAASNELQGVELSWDDQNLAGESSYYTIYRSVGTNAININDASQLIAKVRKVDGTTQSYIDVAVSENETYNYAITALNRLHVESVASSQVTITYNEPTPTPTPTPDENDLEDFFNQFKDISSSHWAIEYLNQMYKLKLFNGYPDATIRPNQAISREEAFLVVYRLFKSKLMPDSDINLNFEDSTSIATWAIEAITILLFNGIIEETPENYINSKNEITRAEFAKLMTLLLQK